ncbi:MAG: glycosyltransferase family 9 protein, partial [Bacteroidia bacterium]
MKILLRRVDNLGDVVIIIPIIAALKQKFPGAYITAMVKPQHRDVLSGYADSFIKPVKSLKSIVGYDKIIDIDYKIPEGYIPKDLKKAKEISLGVKSFRRKRHISRQLYDHLKLHGIKTNFTSPLIHVDPKVNTKAKEWLIDKYINQNDFIITMDPGSNFTKKCWPIGYYVALSSWLVKSFDAKIVLTGATEDASLKFITT